MANAKHSSETIDGGNGKKEPLFFSPTIDGALIALVLTAYAYLAGYAYEIAFVEFYGFPNVVAEVTPNAIARAVLVVTMYLMIVVVVSCTAVVVYCDPKRRVAYAILVGLVLLTMWAMWHASWNGMKWYLAWTGGVLLAWIVITGASAWRRKWEWSIAKDHLEKVAAKFPKPLVYVVVAVACGLVLTGGIFLTDRMGKAETRFKRAYLFHTDYDCRIIRLYGERAVCVTINSANCPTSHKIFAVLADDPRVFTRRVFDVYEGIKEECRPAFRSSAEGNRGL